MDTTGTHKKDISPEAFVKAGARKGKQPEVLELPALNRAERRAQDRRRLSVKREKRLAALKASRL